MKVYAVRLILRHAGENYSTLLKAEWEEEEYKEEKEYFIEENSGICACLTAIPKKPKIEQYHGTYSVEQGFKEEQIKEELEQLELKFKKALYDYFKKQKKLEMQRYKAILSVLDTRERKTKVSRNGSNYMEGILKKYTFK